MKSNYDKHPYVSISSDLGDCESGWEGITGQLLRITTQKKNTVVCVECYPGVLEKDTEWALRGFFPEGEIVRTRDRLKPPSQIESMLGSDLSDDPVFGCLTSLELSDFFRPGELDRHPRNARENHTKFVIGTGAVLAAPHWDVLVYADLSRWEIQHRQRRERSVISVRITSTRQRARSPSAAFLWTGALRIA
jgi:hypothetical protein